MIDCDKLLRIINNSHSTGCWYLPTGSNSRHGTRAEQSSRISGSSCRKLSPLGHPGTRTKDKSGFSSPTARCTRSGSCARTQFVRSHCWRGKWHTSSCGLLEAGQLLVISSLSPCPCFILQKPQPICVYLHPSHLLSFNSPPFPFPGIL